MHNLGYKCASNKIKYYILRLITATFSRCFDVTAAAKSTRTCVYGLKKLDFKTQETMKFITLRPLVASLPRSGSTAWAFGLYVNSIDICVLKSNYYLNHKT